MTLTKMGKALIIVILALLFAGLNTRSNLMHLFNTFLVSIWLLSPFLAKKNLKNLKLKMSTPTEVFMNETFSVNILFCNTGHTDKYSLLLNHKKKEIFIPHIFPFSESITSYEMQWETRGILEWKDIELSTVYPFDFFHYSTRFNVNHQLYVLPSILKIENVPYFSYHAHTNQTQVTNNKISRDEFSMLREYVQGDNPRNIDWKATAKKNSLIVKEYVDLEPIESSFILTFSIENDISTQTMQCFEKLITLVASLASNINKKGTLPYFAVGKKVIKSNVKTIPMVEILRLLAIAKISNATFIAPINKYSNIYIITNKATSEIKKYLKNTSNVILIYPDKESYDKEVLCNQYTFSIHEDVIRLEKLC